jgi:hypothetical protein
MAGLDPAISNRTGAATDGRVKPGQDEHTWTARVGFITGIAVYAAGRSHEAGEG